MNVCLVKSQGRSPHTLSQMNWIPWEALLVFFFLHGWLPCLFYRWGGGTPAVAAWPGVAWREPRGLPRNAHSCAKVLSTLSKSSTRLDGV